MPRLQPAEQLDRLGAVLGPVGDPIRRDEVDETLFADIARRHSMEVVGPIPEGYV